MTLTSSLLSINKNIYSISMTIYSFGSISPILLLLKIILDEKTIETTFKKAISIFLLLICAAISIAQLILIALKKITFILYIANHVTIPILTLTVCIVCLMCKEVNWQIIILSIFISLSTIGYVIAINSCYYFQNKISEFDKLEPWLLNTLYITCAISLITVIFTLIKIEENKRNITIITSINTAIIVALIILSYNEYLKDNAILLNGIEYLSVSNNIVMNTYNRTAKTNKNVLYNLESFLTTIITPNGNRIIECDAPLPYNPNKYNQIITNYQSKGNEFIYYNVNTFYHEDKEKYQVINRIIFDGNAEIISQTIISYEDNITMHYDFIHNTTSTNALIDYEQTEYKTSRDTIRTHTGQIYRLDKILKNNTIIYIRKFTSETTEIIYDIQNKIAITIENNKITALSEWQY